MTLLIDFANDLFAQPTWIPIWVGWLMSINLAGFYFWSHHEGRAVAVTFLVSAAWMMTLYGSFGFAKILGAGHVLWVPLVAWLLSRAGRVERPRLRSWIYVVIVSNSISLIFDIRDVWIYFHDRF